jgi:hypothetical protein
MRPLSRRREIRGSQSGGDPGWTALMTVPDPESPVRVRLVGPEGAPHLQEGILRLTGPQGAPTPDSIQLVALRDGSVVGVAVYELVDGGVRVRQLALAWQHQESVDRTLDVLLRAVESACLAAGRCSVTVCANAINLDPMLEVRGYHSRGQTAGLTKQVT